jgi:hypothetical protein
MVLLCEFIIHEIHVMKLSCEVCSAKMAAMKVTAISVNEFNKDGTIKIHYTCSNHIVELYKKL